MSAESEAGTFRPPRFDVEVAEEDGTVVLRLSGELDLVSEPILEAALARAKGSPVRVDLSDLAFMDSTGLRALLGAARSYPDLKLVGPLQAPVRRLLDLTQTHAILPFES